MTKAVLLLIVSFSASMIGSAVAAPTKVRNCTGTLIQPSGDAPAAKEHETRGWSANFA